MVWWLGGIKHGIHIQMKQLAVDTQPEVMESGSLGTQGKKGLVLPERFIEFNSYESLTRL